MSQLLINDEYLFPEHLLSVIFEFLTGPQSVVVSRVSRRWYRAACIAVRYHYLIQRMLAVYSLPGQTVTAKTLFELLSDPFKPLLFITAHITGASKVLLGDKMLFVGKLCCTAAQGKDSEYNNNNFLIRGLEESKIIKLAAKHLHSLDDDILEHAAWCVSNLSYFPQGKEAFMSEPKAFPRLCSLLQRDPMPRQSVMRVIVWSISNLLNDERIQSEFCKHKDWINAYLDISSKVPKTSEIRLQAFRGIWNLGGRNAKKKSSENIQILRDLNALRILDAINFETEKQNLTLCIYAIGFSTEIIRFYPEEITKLIEKADVINLFASLAAQTTLKNQYHSYHLMWEVVYGLVLACQSDVVCKKLNLKKCLELLNSFPKFKNFRKINMNISYVTAKLSVYHKHRADWEIYLQHLVEVGRTYIKSTVTQRNLVFTLKNIDEDLAMNVFGTKRLQEENELYFFNGNYDSFVLSKDLTGKILGTAATRIKEIVLFGINYICRNAEIQSLAADAQKDLINLIVLEVSSSLSASTEFDMTDIARRFDLSLKNLTNFE